MKYGAVEFDTQQDSTSIAKRKKQEIRHYPGTDQADVISQGRPPTVIRTTMIAYTESERILYEQLMHTEGIENELYLGKQYYKKVTTGESSEPKPVLSPDNEKAWLIDAEFIALDPIPYDTNTGEALY